jgi:uncharacterized phage-like protein YoqJ
MKIAITGHRPEKLDEQWTKDALKQALSTLKPDVIYVGMAAGVDLWSAVTAYHLGIPWICAKPWAGHRPRVADEYMYSWVERHAQEIINVSPEMKYPGVWVYHKRNEYMVDHADDVLAVWDGSRSGGTAACVRYAQRSQKVIHRVDPKTQEILEKSTVQSVAENIDTLFDM